MQYEYEYNTAQWYNSTKLPIYVIKTENSPKELAARKEFNRMKSASEFSENRLFIHNSNANFHKENEEYIISLYTDECEPVHVRKVSIHF